LRALIWRMPILLLMVAACGTEESSPTPGSCRPAETTCEGGACIGDPWSAGEFGDPCASGQECTSGICGQDTQTGTKFCTQTCKPEDAEPCPQGAECLLTGDATGNVCGPPVPC